MDRVQSGSAGLNFGGLRVLVVGLAREGTAAARFLAAHGAQVTVTDAKSAGDLAEPLAALEGVPIELALGGHPERLLEATDVLVVSPGVPLEIPFLARARQRGLPLSSETRLFTHLCPAPVAGITGSSGKTTTTALVGEMLQAAGRRTWVGGNIGRPLIEHLPEIDPSDAVVMELSSFQLEFFAPWPAAGPESKPGSPLLDPEGWSPPLAALLNLTPNHLDRHGTMEAYIAAKAHILAYQRAGDVAVLNLDDPVCQDMAARICRRTGAHVLWFSLEDEAQEGGFLRGQQLVLRLDGQEWPICSREELRLLGRHNVANALAALTLAGAAGVPVEALRQVATRFAGVEHRLELVRQVHGVRWYNDSIATSPERTMAALRAFQGPIVLLAGGRDKHLPWEEMAALAWRKVRHLILFGEAASKVEAAMARTRPESGSEMAIHRAGTLADAVALARRLAREGDVVLLSPGGTSFDAYRDFVERGEHFRRLVQELE
ncbi:MAG: UDP-N-acetylmuramoyl-L-alanine--D-glutamate ligase [Anaerolineae bacterium]